MRRGHALLACINPALATRSFLVIAESLPWLTYRAGQISEQSQHCLLKALALDIPRSGEYAPHAMIKCGLPREATLAQGLEYGHGTI